MARATRSLRGGKSKDVWNRFYAPIPKWGRYLITLFSGYAMLNFVIFFFLISNEPTVVRRENGEYAFKTAINGETQFITATKTDYDRYETKVLRDFSGHWMIFYLVPTVYFWFPRTEAFPQGQDRGLVEEKQDNNPSVW